MEGLTQVQQEELLAAGVPLAPLKAFQKALKALKPPAHPAREKMKADTAKAREIYRAGAKILDLWPPRARRDTTQARAAETVKSALRAARDSFARTYVDLIFSLLTDGYRRIVRADELVYEVARLCPGLCPDRREVEAELGLRLAEKDGVEAAQTDFLTHVFAHRRAGLYLIHSMLQPLPASQELLDRFRRDGKLDLGTARVERRGPMGCVFFNNLDYLNAEDDNTVLPLETATDLVLLSPEIEVGLLRGNPVEHPKYRGRRIFSAGLNLTHLYYGKLPLMFYINRDLGFVNKIYRGLADKAFEPDGVENTLEKPWVAVLEAFAIGGGCQLLLVVDYVIAEEGSYFNLPARKEGIIPGVSPMRFSRFVGERAAQQGILFDKTFPASSTEARGVINEVVPRDDMDAAIERTAKAMAGTGVVSAGANRKALRVGEESRDQLRQYMALYCREQANCHFSPALVANLERHWLGPRAPKARAPVDMGSDPGR
jgi:thioesterase DpgC